MRALHAAVLVSVVVHAAVLGALTVLRVERRASQHPAARLEPPVPRIEVIAQPPDPAPIDVVIWSNRTVACSDAKAALIYHSPE